MASDRSSLTSSSNSGLTGTILEYNATLYLNEDLSDVTFCVENKRLPAHKIVLCRCDYFRALFRGGLVESTKREIRPNVGAAPFKEILRYIYVGYLSLFGMSDATMINILHLSDMYTLSELASNILVKVKQNDHIG